LVSVQSQVAGFAEGKPTTTGPFFRIAIKEGATETNDGVFGFYFNGTAGTRSTVQERTKLIPVKAGIAYNFGAYYGSPSGEWAEHSSSYEVTYICFGG